MRTDHRRPLVAYVLVALACSVVVSQGLREAPSRLGPPPSVRTFADTSLLPSEFAGTVSEPPELDRLPDAELVDVREDEPFVPGVEVVTDTMDEIPWDTDASDETDVGGSSTGTGGVTPDPVGDGAQPVAGPSQAELVGGGGAPTAGGSATGGGSSAGGSSDPIFGGASTGAGDPDDGGGEGPDNGNGSPAPHSFDDVPPGAHPNGHVGPRPDKGPKNNSSKDDDSKGRGPKGEGPDDDASQDDESKDDESKDGASQDDESKDDASQGNGSKSNGSKGNGSKGNGSKGNGSKGEAEGKGQGQAKTAGKSKGKSKGKRGSR